MEILLKHFGLMRKLDDKDAALDVRIIEYLEEVRLQSQPTMSELRVKVAQSVPLDRFKARVVWLQEQGLVELIPTGHAGSHRVGMTDAGRQWAREFECQRQVQG